MSRTILYFTLIFGLTGLATPEVKARDEGILEQCVISDSMLIRPELTFCRSRSAAMVVAVQNNAGYSGK
ncbi:MAG: hypothetical protein AB2L20_31835 [Mangrovibacterium sp.]